MKTQTQILTVALAISFVTALALAVALICVFLVRDEPPLSTEEGYPTPTTAELLTLLPPATLPPATTAEEEPTTEAERGNGLLFSTYGNGTCILVGLGSCTDACVVIPEFAPNGDRVVEIAARAFYGAPSIAAIQIPAGVARIGALAFGDCRNLSYVSVSERNTAYCDRDGVLYTADGETLLLYPALRQGSAYTLRREVREIREMAFYNCVYLKTVNYTGTAEDWDGMRIGSKNHSLTAAAKTFASTDGK